jgi:alanine racemase
MMGLRGQFAGGIEKFGDVPLTFGRLRARFSRASPAPIKPSAAGESTSPAPDQARAIGSVTARPPQAPAAPIKPSHVPAAPAKPQHEPPSPKPSRDRPTAAGPPASVPEAPKPGQIDASGPPALETSGILTIDLAAIVKNWKAMANRVVPADCAAVIKADGYGCGIEKVAAALARAGCTTFFVADLAEARRARAAMAAVAPDAAIYVLNGLAPGTSPIFAEINARPVIGSLAEFVEWDAYRTAASWGGGAALHFDTGMNRLGFALEEAPQFTTRMKMPNHGISLVMSHLACADTPNHPLNARQIAAFRDLRFMFRGTPTSLANSSGIFLGPAAHCDLVRTGAALFGVNPTPAPLNLMEPVIALKARIVQVRDVARGKTVGYGATWTAARTSRVAIVSVGYGDGYPRAADGTRPGNKGSSALAERSAKSGAFALIAGQRCPMAGRISMDLMAFDVTRLSHEAVRRGAYAILIGDDITVDDVAAWSGTIGYEVLTSLGRRYRREWKW